MSPTAVYYSPQYRVSFFGLERDHPFDIGKYERIADALLAGGHISRAHLVAPQELPLEAFVAAHTRTYLDTLTQAEILSKVLEIVLPSLTPSWMIEDKLLRPMRLACSGTVEASRAALSDGFSINLGGGFHHAHRAMGHGFCVYNDVALAVSRLRAGGFTGRILVLDTDAHQGDGNHAVFRDDPTVYTFSMHQGDAFPTPKVPGDWDEPLPRGMDDEAFLHLLSRALDEILEVFQPDLIFHVAGADVLHDDPLTDLALSLEGLVARDCLVQHRAREEGVPLTHLLAGGYGPSAAAAQLASLTAMLHAHATHRPTL